MSAKNPRTLCEAGKKPRMVCVPETTINAQNAKKASCKKQNKVYVHGDTPFDFGTCRDKKTSVRQQRAEEKKKRKAVLAKARLEDADFQSGLAETKKQIAEYKAAKPKKSVKKKYYADLSDAEKEVAKARRKAYRDQKNKEAAIRKMKKP